MKTIWKFPVSLDGPIKLPRGAEILTVGAQDDEPQLWALVDPEAPKVERQIKCYGTGSDMPEQPGDYLGTLQLFGGTLVFHAFEEI